MPGPAPGAGQHRGEKFRPGLCLLSPCIPVGRTEAKQINTADPHHSRFPCCKFANLLQFICDPENNTCVGREVNSLSSRVCPFSARVGQGDALSPCCSCHGINQRPLVVLNLVPGFSRFFVCVLFFVILLGLVLKCWLVFLSTSNLGCKYLTEKTYVLDQLRSGMSYSGVGHEFKVNRNAVSLNRHAPKTS